MAEELNKWMNENEQMENFKSLQNRFITKWRCFKLLIFADTNLSVQCFFLVPQKSAARQEWTLSILTSSPGSAQQATRHNASNQTLPLTRSEEEASPGAQALLQLLLHIGRTLWELLAQDPNEFYPAILKLVTRTAQGCHCKLFHPEAVTLVVVIN